MELNLYKILGEKEEGTKLYSPVCGELLLNEVTPNGIFCGQSDGMKYEQNLVFMSDGHLKNYGYWIDHGECLIFPSASMRDWSKFFKRGDVVYSPSSQMYAIFDGWVDDTYTEFNTTLNLYPNHEIGKEEVCKTECFEIVKAGTREYSSVMQDFEKLFNGKYNEETLEVERCCAEELPKTEMEEEQFKAFDKVLVRCTGGVWSPTFFSRYDHKSKWIYVSVDLHNWEQCIPYNEETAHLAGTAKDYEKGGKGWKK